MGTHNKTGRPTQRSIAREVGLSVAAVSRALSDDPRIALKTRELVKKTAAGMGYVPDRAAQRLRTGRTNVISLVLPPHEELLGFGTSLVRGISNILWDSRYHLVVMPTFGTETEDTTVRRIVENGLADGVLLSRSEPNDIRIKYLLEHDFPFVCHGRTELATAHPYVDFDNFEFAREAVRKLAAKGADKVMILLPPAHLTFRHHLRQGFMSGVRETGVDFADLESVNLDSDPEHIESAIQETFSREDRPNGLVLPGDTSALAALAALQDIGCEPGRDVHLMIKQTSGVFGFVRPHVESVFEDIAAAGEQMAQFLLKRIEGAPLEELQSIQHI